MTRKLSKPSIPRTQKRTVWLGFLTVLLLASCTGTGTETQGPDPKELFCALARPIYISGNGDTLTDETAKEIDAHNNVGRKHCGWK